MLPVAGEIQCILRVVNRSLCRISTIPLVLINNLIHNLEQDELQTCIPAIKAPREDKRWQETDSETNYGPQTQDHQIDQEVLKTQTLTFLVIPVVAAVIQGGLDSVEEMSTIRTTINNKADMTLIGRDKDSTEGCQTVQEVEDEDVVSFRCSISKLSLKENIWRSIYLCSK